MDGTNTQPLKKIILDYPEYMEENLLMNFHRAMDDNEVDHPEVLDGEYMIFEQQVIRHIAHNSTIEDLNALANAYNLRTGDSFGIFTNWVEFHPEDDLETWVPLSSIKEQLDCNHKNTISGSYNTTFFKYTCEMRVTVCQTCGKIMVLSAETQEFVKGGTSGDKVLETYGV